MDRIEICGVPFDRMRLAEAVDALMRRELPVSVDSDVADSGSGVVAAGSVAVAGSGLVGCAIDSGEVAAAGLGAGLGVGAGVGLGAGGRVHRALRVYTPNPEMLLEAAKNPEFLKVLRGGDLNVPDGVGILWAARYLGKEEFPERVAGTDLMIEICARAARTCDRVFLLGAAPGVADRVRGILQKRYPGLNVCGTYDGNPSDAEYARVRERILAVGPDILFVAYGAPAQEMWIARHICDFPTLRFAMGVGGAFDFIAGERKRAPRAMRSLGLEWLFRLIQEPSRIKRIYNAVVRFSLMVRNVKKDYTS